MANPTTYFGWVMPTATDLVTDLPADFGVFGQGVDTSMQGLLGGTTGQVLSKTSNTNMAFTWVAQDDSNAIQNAIVDAKGDLIGASAADTPARLAVGTNDQVLTADSAQATGLKWATPSSGMTKIVTANFSAVTSVNVNNCFTSTYTNYMVIVNGLGDTGAPGEAYIQMQTGTNTVLTSSVYYWAAEGLTSANSGTNFYGAADTKFGLGQVSTGTRNMYTAYFSNVGNSSQKANMTSVGNLLDAGGSTNSGGFVDTAGTYTGIKILGQGNISGTYTVYGLAK